MSNIKTPNPHSLYFLFVFAHLVWETAMDHQQQRAGASQARPPAQGGGDFSSILIVLFIFIAFFALVISHFSLFLRFRFCLKTLRAFQLLHWSFSSYSFQLDFVFWRNILNSRNWNISMFVDCDSINTFSQIWLIRCSPSPWRSCWGILARRCSFEDDYRSRFGPLFLSNCVCLIACLFHASEFFIFFRFSFQDASLNPIWACSSNHSDWSGKFGSPSHEDRELDSAILITLMFVLEK